MTLFDRLPTQEDAFFRIDTQPAVFLERLNRFAARVIWRQQEVVAHVPNSGRLKELLVPGAEIRVRPGGGAKTCCRLMLARHQGRWALVDAHLTNDLLEFAVRGGRVIPSPSDIRREVVWGESRLDLACEGNDGRHLMEAKCVTLVEGGAALFPDAPTQRGCRHLRELIRARQNGLLCHVLFFVQQEGAVCFRANGQTDPEFSRLLEEAAEAGVEVCAFACQVRENGIAIRGVLPWEHSGKVS
jgi:sugar fermentation stimulation protein A